MQSVSAPRQTRGPLIAAGGLIALLAFNWVAAIARFQVEGLYWDQWVFCRPLFQDHVSWLELFGRQHGPHRQGLAFDLTAVVMRWAHWDTRVEGLWIAGWLVVAAVLGVMWKRRLTGRLGWADLWLPLALLSVRQFETVLVVPNLSHSVFPLVLLLTMAWMLAAPMSPARWIVWGALGGVALFTGFGILAWVAAVGLVLLHGGRALARQEGSAGPGPALAAVVLALALVGFLQGYRWDTGSEGAALSPAPWWDYLSFVARMLASRMDLAGGAAGALVAGGAVLLVALVALGHASWRLVREPDPAPAWAVAVFLLVAGLGYAGFTAVGRVQLGPAAADAPRYVTLVGAIWLGLVAWAAARGARGWAGAAALLGWSSIALSWPDLARREWADWPGTLGMSEVTRNAIEVPNLRKLEWLLTWEETGDWRAAEARVPAGIFGEAAALDLGRQIDWLAARGLTFADPAKGPRAWLPWWNPRGVTWVKAMVGEHRRWMREEAILLVEGRPGGFLNLRSSGQVAGLPIAAGVEIEFDGRRAVVGAEHLAQGISLPATAGRSKLVLRSRGGVVAFDPPNGLGAVSFLLENPTLTAQPSFAVRGWMADAAGLWPERSLEVVAGLHDWESQGAWAWTEAVLDLRCRALGAAFLNVEISSRYQSVDHGPVRVRIDGAEQELPWVAEGLRLSIPIEPGRMVAVTLSNDAGARSPQAAGESSDARQLALRISHLSLDETAAYPVLAPGPKVLAARDCQTRAGNGMNRE